MVSGRFDIKAGLTLLPACDDASAISLDGESIRICRLIRDVGSLNKAAHELHVSYSRVWRTVRRLEDAFGIQLLETNGARGSVLTEDALRLISAYEAAQEAAQEAAVKSFSRSFR